MMSLRLEPSQGALLQATTLKAFVRGPGVTGFPRWRISSIVHGEATLRHNEGTTCDLRSMTRQALLALTLEVSIGTYMRDSEVYNEIVKPCLPHRPPLSLEVFIRRKSTLARGGLVAIIWKMIDYGNRVSIFIGPGHNNSSCYNVCTLITAVLSKQGCWVNMGVG